MRVTKPLKKLIIIPAYNEEKNLDFVIADIQSNAPDFDYIIINDCSTDQTRALCDAKGYHCIHLSQNLGIGGCVQTGYLYALRNDYDIAVQFDGDGQHDASYLEPMLSAMQEESADMIIGSRFLIKQGFQSTQMRQIGIRFLSCLIAFFHKKRIKDVTSGLRMVDQGIIQDFCQYYPADYPEPETLALCLRKKYHIVEFPLTMRERQEGESSITLTRSVYYMVKVSLSIIIDALKPKPFQ